MPGDEAGGIPAEGEALRARAEDRLTDAEVLALAIDNSTAESVCEIDDGREGGYSYDDMAAAASAAVGRRVRSFGVPRTALRIVAAANGRRRPRFPFRISKIPSSENIPK